MRLAQPIHTKWRIWLRGVDLNHRPLGYEPTEACQTVQEQGTTAQKTLHLASEFSAGLGWFCTPFPHISRTPRIEGAAACAKLVSDLAATLWWIVEKVSLQAAILSILWRPTRPFR